MPKHCPDCGLANTPKARQCPCGYEFSGRDASAWKMSAYDDGPVCDACGARRETKYVDFHQHVGMLVMMMHSSANGNMCRECINQKFWTMTGITAAVGWFGFISFFVTPFVLLNNVVRYLACSGMGANAPTEKAAPDREPQLVGQNCAMCGEWIGSTLDARYCPQCGEPGHEAGIRIGQAGACPACGAPSHRSQ